MHAAHMHAAEVDARGDAAMGFSHEAAHHTFRELPDGGAIEIAANGKDDTKTIAAIRDHLQSVAKAFAAGDFDKPQFIHGKTPDGVDVMKSRKDAIRYKYEEQPAGARVMITTEDAKAVTAVHDFLRFQDSEHNHR